MSNRARMRVLLILAICTLLPPATGCVLLHAPGPEDGFSVVYCESLPTEHSVDSICACGLEHSHCQQCSSPCLESCTGSISNWLHTGIVLPAFPAVPVPQFFMRWKERRDLPKGPDGAQFHPLPTRPMFQTRPTAQTLHDMPEEWQGSSTSQLLDNRCDYGRLPTLGEWNVPTSAITPQSDVIASP
jgi:hypothetical protein